MEIVNSSQQEDSAHTGPKVHSGHNGHRGRVQPQPKMRQQMRSDIRARQGRWDPHLLHQVSQPSWPHGCPPACIFLLSHQVMPLHHAAKFPSPTPYLSFNYKTNTFVFCFFDRKWHSVLRVSLMLRINQDSIYTLHYWEINKKLFSIPKSDIKKSSWKQDSGPYTFSKVGRKAACKTWQWALALEGLEKAHLNSVILDCRGWTAVYKPGLEGCPWEGMES